MFRNDRDVARWYGLDPDDGLPRRLTPTRKEPVMATKKKSAAYLAAYGEGTDAVRARPLYSPANPYEHDEEPDKHEGWEAGATDAGWNEIYTNGVLDKAHRR